MLIAPKTKNAGHTAGMLPHAEDQSVMRLQLTISGMSSLKVSSRPHLPSFAVDLNAWLMTFANMVAQMLLSALIIITIVTTPIWYRPMMNKLSQRRWLLLKTDASSPLAWLILNVSIIMLATMELASINTTSAIELLFISHGTILQRNGALWPLRIAAWELNAIQTSNVPLIIKRS